MHGQTKIYLYLHQQFSDTVFIPFSNSMVILLPDQNQGKEINTNPGTWHRRIENSRNICTDPDLTEKKPTERKKGWGAQHIDFSGMLRLLQKLHTKVHAIYNDRLQLSYTRFTS